MDRFVSRSMPVFFDDDRQMERGAAIFPDDVHHAEASSVHYLAYWTETTGRSPFHALQKRYCQLNVMMSLFSSQSGEEILFFEQFYPIL